METLKVNMEELKNEQMYVWVAPDGFPQMATIAPDFPMCVAMAEMFATTGICKSPSVMWEEGFQILPVSVTITQNGDADKAFNDWKKAEQIKE